MSPLDWACNSHAFQLSSPTFALLLLNGKRIPGDRATQNYATWTTFVVLWTSPTFRSQTWKSSQPTEIHGEVPALVVWAHPVRCQIKQLQINAPAGTTGATGPRCPQCSRVCASEFGLRSHLRSHISRPSQRS